MEETVVKKKFPPIKNEIFIHNRENFFKALADSKELPFTRLEDTDFELGAFDTEPIEQYQFPVHPLTHEPFPHCCPYHDSIYKDAKRWFEKFPDCCEAHKKLFKETWFKKEKYDYVPLKAVRQISFTAHHIVKKIDTEGWFKDITDYLYYNIRSFGQLPRGCGNAVGIHIYTGHVKDWIKKTKAPFPAEKRKKLVEYLNSYDVPVKSEKKEKNKKEGSFTDLNVLYAAYQRWLKIFPFDLSFFSHLKPHFDKHLPFLNGKPVVNNYTGLASAKLHTRDSLIEALINLTNYLLTQINTVSLYEKGQLTDVNKTYVELVISERKQQLKEGYKNDSTDEETRYRKMIKEWLKDEEVFLEKITPALKNMPPPKENDKKEYANNVFTFRSKYFHKNKHKLNLLYDQLYETWIDKSANLNNFRRIFSNKMPDPKIIWLSGKRELKYLILQLKKDERIAPGKIWTAAQNAFILQEEPEYDLNDLGNLDVPEDLELKGAIDTIIKSL